MNISHPPSTPFWKAVVLLALILCTSLACSLQETIQDLQGGNIAATAAEESPQEQEETLPNEEEETQEEEPAATLTRTPRATSSPTPDFTQTPTGTFTPIAQPITSQNAADVVLLRTIDAHLTRQVTGLAISPIVPPWRPVRLNRW